MSDIIEKIKELERKVDLYEAVIELLDVGIHVIDTERKTLLYNKTMGKLEGEDPDGMIGRPFMDGNNFFLNKESTLLRVLQTREVVSDNTQTYWNSKGQPVVTVNKTQPLIIKGQMTGALETATDITYIRLLAKKIMDLHESSSKHKKRAKKVNPCPEVRYIFDSIIGRSAAITQAISHARKIAQTSSNVLIYGESGTGKELFAQSIHAASDRSDKPFIDINCAALPSQLLEGLLFGSVKGGFTDAQDRPGLFEQADQGTLLLDEINSMHMSLQGKLLRALQEKRIRRLGATASTPIDVRIISTINKSPEQAMEQKELREDLFYRLSVANLNLTPLRNRPEDIPEYIDFFIKKYANTLGLEVTACSPKVAALFQHHPWPGNVRQLEHVIEGALNLVNRNDRTLMLEHLPMLFKTGEAGVAPESIEIAGGRLESGDSTDSSLSALAGQPDYAPREFKLRSEKQSMECRAIKNALLESNNNISQAARGLGITRQLLQYKIKKYCLKSNGNSQKSN